MILFVWNLLLAAVWALAVGEFSLAQLCYGFVLGYAILWLTNQRDRSARYFVKVPQTVVFAGFYLIELIIATLRVAYDVVTPAKKMRPGVIALPLDATTDAEITLLANLITLTPGTLALFLSPDRTVLYVHIMYLDGPPDTARRRMKHRLERRVLELLR